MFEMSSFLKSSDVLVIAVPLIDFESVVASLPVKHLQNKLVVEVCPLSAHAKKTLLHYLPADVDIISSNLMFGPSSTDSEASWDGQPVVYEKVRIRDERRSDNFFRIFERARCQMVQMTAEQQDMHTADAEFVTHLTGRLLGNGNMLPPTPVSSKEYAALCDVADMTSGDTFDLFYGMYKFNDRARDHVAKMRENLAKVERQLAAKEAYLTASEELRNSDRQRLVAECKELLKEIVNDKKATSDEQSKPSGDI
jgi:prephenate dehydrogenase